MAHVIEVVEHHEGRLGADKRCDRCGAQAYVEVALASGGTLLFCAHHGTEHWPALVAIPDAMIADERPVLHKTKEPEHT